MVLYRDKAYWEEVERAVGKGAPTLLLGTSTRSLKKSLAELKEQYMVEGATAVVRAGRADRDRYIEHLHGLYASGHIEKDELDGLEDMILAVRNLDSLDAALEGLPKPPPIPRPRDMGIPENFMPYYMRRVLAGIAVAVLPIVALAGLHGVFANIVTAVFCITGFWVSLMSLMNMCMYAGIWDNTGSDVRKKRRERDGR